MDSVGNPEFDPSYVTKPEYAYCVDKNGGSSEEYINPVDVVLIID